MDRFEAFFKSLQDYKIRTYDKEDETTGVDKKPYHEIDYSFVSSITELFAKTNRPIIGADFEKIFKSKSSVILLDTQRLPTRSAKNTSTIKRKLEELQPDAYRANEEIINRVFTEYGQKMTREELLAAIEKINKQITASEDGESETSA